MHQILGKIRILRLSQNPELMLIYALIILIEPNFEYSSLKNGLRDNVNAKKQ